ncbi:MAG: hypothetical protein ABSC08_15235, partial [Bryobacteraceae bacterium]
AQSLAALALCALALWFVNSLYRLWRVQDDLKLSGVVTDQKWGDLVLQSFEIANDSPSFDAKDPVIECAMQGASGTTIKTATKTLYQEIPAGLSRKFGPLAMGPVPDQMTSFNCKIVGASAKW